MGYRVFKTTYTDHKGKTREAAKWYVEFRDHNEAVRRLPAFTSKAASEEMGRNLVKLVEYHQGTGGQTDPALCRWLASVPRRTRDKLVSIGLLNPERVAVSKPLAEHLDDFAKALTAKGNSAYHVTTVTARARRIIDGCGFRRRQGAGLPWRPAGRHGGEARHQRPDVQFLPRGYQAVLPMDGQG